ncbi:MAG: XrtA-associated tyrosine autokinase [Geothermobacteraceae bacterium]
MSRIDEAIEMALGATSLKVSEPEAPASGEAIDTGDIGEAFREDRPSGFPAVAPLPARAPELVTVHQPKGRVAEEYRKLQGQLMQLLASRPECWTVLLTSSTPGEGKSLTSANLAVSMARQLDHTVLLVDTDLRRSSIAQMFGLEGTPGLVQVLMGEARLEEALVHTGHGRLVLLPAGDGADNPVELLSSSQMKNLLRELRERYSDRLVLLDSPPVLAFADAAILATLADAVLYVVREGQTSKVQMQKGISLLPEGKVVGAVYNACRYAVNPGYGYYG